MRTFIRTTKDATIYQRFPTLNTGMDEILEVGKVTQELDGGNMFSSASVRFLMDFDVPSGSFPEEAKYFLNLHIAHTTGLDRYQKLHVHTVTQSWDEGSGIRFQNTVVFTGRTRLIPVLDPDTGERTGWERVADDSGRLTGPSAWTRDGATWADATREESWQELGGDFDPVEAAEFEFIEPRITDVRIEVTDLFRDINDGTIPQEDWRGIIVKFPDEDEGDPQNVGNVRFFSRDTHTVFEPRLEVAWENQEFNPPAELRSIAELGGLANKVKVAPRNLKQEYIRGERGRIYLVVRDAYPNKSFNTVQRYRNTYYLPETSYFRITDSVSGVKLYDFDEFSALGCDEEGSYIELDTSGLEINRHYTLELKVRTDDTTFFPDFNHNFRVVRDGKFRE